MWKQDAKRDVGLAAEEVGAVEPLLTFRNEQGEIEGVKYANMSVVFINAIKEQQQQIAAQEERLRQQQQQIDELRKLLCRSHPNADVCRQEK